MLTGFAHFIVGRIVCVRNTFAAGLVLFSYVRDMRDTRLWPYRAAANYMARIMTPSDLFKYALSTGIAAAMLFFVYMLGVVTIVIWRTLFPRK